MIKEFPNLFSQSTFDILLMIFYPNVFHQAKETKKCGFITFF